MNGRLSHLYESMDRRDLFEIAILATIGYIILRILSRTRGSGLLRGLGLLVLALFLVAQIVLAGFDLAELGRLLDQLLTTAIVGFFIIFQPELRRGLILLGRHPGLRMFADTEAPYSNRLAETASILSREHVGALIAVQRQTSLNQFVETGERIDAEINVPLLRAIFHHHSPLHDGAVIVGHGRLLAAGCQLPLCQPLTDGPRTGMRHRAAVGLSEETDAVVIVVSEETGRISLAVGGMLEVVDRQALADRLAAELSNQPSKKKPRLRLTWGRLVAGLQR